MQKELKIIHTADTHLGYKQYHSEVRRKDFLEAFSKVILDAIDMHADAVIHAGDLFDSRIPSLEDILDTMKLFATLKSANIPLLAIVGNHESKQTTQWLDLFVSMELAVRLNTKPYMLKNVAFYGIDNVTKSKIPTYDFSVFEEAVNSECNILVMHQLLSPITIGEWDCSTIINSLPFHVDAILLGDYHKYEKRMVDNTWVTYCGSTERNSFAEMDNRSYNIITISDSIDISRKTIDTRDFLKIPVSIDNSEKIYDNVLSVVQEFDVKDKVVSVEINSDNTNVNISHAEIEEMLLSRGALISGVRDLRNIKDDINEPMMSIAFYDPDEAVKKEIKKMHLSDGGLLIDEIVRDLNLAKTKVSDETEKKLEQILDNIDFSKSIILNKEHHITLNSNIMNNDDTIEEKNESCNTPSVSKLEIITETQKLFDAQKSVKYELECTENDTVSKKSIEKKMDKDSLKPKQYNLGDYF